MLNQLLDSGWTLERMTTATLASELLSTIERTAPDVLCIATFPPSGLGQASYLCKRIRKRFATLPIWILRCDDHESMAKATEQLIADGAQQVATSFAVALAQLPSFVFAASEPSGEKNRRVDEEGSANALAAPLAAVAVVPSA
jgi:hypothetical protein